MAQHPAGGTEVADGPGPQQTSPGPAGLRRWCGPPVAVRAVLLGAPEQSRAAEAAARDERGPGEREQPPPVRTPARLTVVRDGVLRRDHGTGPVRDGVRRGARGVGGGGYGVGRSGSGVRRARRRARVVRVVRAGRGARTVPPGSGVRHQRRDPVLVVADQAGHRIPLPPRAGRGPLRAPAQHLGHRGTLRRVARQAGGEEHPPLGRRGPVQIGLAPHRPVQHLVRGTGAEGRPARRQPGEQRREGEHIGGGGGPGVGRQQFGGDEPGRADDLPGVREGLVGRPPGDAEVQDLRAAPGEHHVRRLEIAVDQPGPVDARQRLRERRPQPGQRSRAQRSERPGGLGERRPGTELGRQPRPYGIGAGVQHRGRERTGDRPCGERLAPEPLPEQRVGGEVLMDGLHRRQPARRGARQMDPPHAALAEQCHEPVPRDLLHAVCSPLVPPGRDDHREPLLCDARAHRLGCVPGCSRRASSGPGENPSRATGAFPKVMDMHLPVRRRRLLPFPKCAAATGDLGRRERRGARCAGDGYFWIRGSRVRVPPGSGR